MEKILSRAALTVQHRVMTRTNPISQRITSRSMNLMWRTQSTKLKLLSIPKITRCAPVLGAYSKRYASTVETINASSNEILKRIETPGKTVTPSTVDVGSTAKNVEASAVADITDPIPDIPIVQSVQDLVTHGGEIPFRELGLASWWPAGWIQSALEVLHINAGLPWWECIIVGTITLRLLVFPLVIKSQRNQARLASIAPEIARLTNQIREARQTGDMLRVSRNSNEYMDFIRKNNYTPSLYLPMFAQAPIFISVFYGLRSMAELPVESMKVGGLWWFQDLTAADPYYILPTLTCATLSLCVNLAMTKGAVVPFKAFKYMMQAMPFIVFIFTYKFPACLVLYWATTNILTVCQISLLKIPKIRDYFKIPVVIPPPAAVGNRMKKGFIADFKEGLKSMKTAREIGQRAHLDQSMFNKAGRGPIPKTFAYNPTTVKQEKSKKASVKVT